MNLLLSNCLRAHAPSMLRDTRQILIIVALILAFFVPMVGNAASKSAAAHETLYLEDRYPSARKCGVCHPRQFEEWSVSQHAYAQISPVYMAMQTAVNLLTSGTNGDFCLRCHTPVGTQIEEPLTLSNLDRNPASREGITCIACHRVSAAYGKISGRLSLDEGDLTAPVKGPLGNEEMLRVLSEKKKYRNLSTDANNSRGKKVHSEVEHFFEISEPGFCGTCHDVLLVNGFRLEEALSDYRTSPAAGNGVTCQDCHMGKVQGKDSGYHEGPAARVGKAKTAPRRTGNHYFAGPDHSIVHPGIFPHPKSPPRNLKTKTLREWLKFDLAAGWGAKKFEKTKPKKDEFPSAWKTTSHRKAARKLIVKQCELLDWAHGQRIEVLESGLGFGDLSAKSSRKRIKLQLPVKNLTDGHNVPTGFDAERLIFVDITVTDQNGREVYRSGDRDPNGDVRDLHSNYVISGELPLDRELFNLQSKFLTRLARGGEHEQVLPINQSVSARPFVRPETRPTILYGRPAGARKHRKVLSALGERKAKYKIDVSGDIHWPLKVKANLVVQAVPANLISAISLVGFDYEMSEKEVAERVVNGATIIDVLEAEIAKDGSIHVSKDSPDEFNACGGKAFNKGKCTFSSPVCIEMTSL